MGEYVNISELNLSSGEYFRLFSLVPGIKFIYVEKPLSSESGQHHLANSSAFMCSFMCCGRGKVTLELGEASGELLIFHLWWPREAVPAIMQQIFYKISCILGNTMVSFSSLCCFRVDICSSS